MGNDIAVNVDRAGLPEPFGPVRGQGMQWSERSSATEGFTLEMLLRVLREHWKVVLAAVLAGAAASVIVTLMTTPLYRAKVVLEINPPTVEALDDDKGTSRSSGVDVWDTIATQVGLLKSQSLGERVAQDLNLALNPKFVAQSGDVASRVKAAGAKVAGGIKAELPKEGQLVEFTYTSDDPQIAALVANGIADSFIDSGLQRRYDASNYAREFLLRQINKTRGDLDRSERSLVAYAQSEGIINTGSGESAGVSDANSLQGASLVALNAALAQATAQRIARFGAILGEAAQQFDRVIIDGPPLLGLADAVLLATAAENVVMVVEYGRTRTKAAREAIDRLRSAGAHVLGVVLTKSKEEASGYGYRAYRYGSVEDRRDDLILISNQSEA